ncbi:unnamed protein product, partial [Heterosigma akashiwo]
MKLVMNKRTPIGMTAILSVFILTVSIGCFFCTDAFIHGQKTRTDPTQRLINSFAQPEDKGYVADSVKDPAAKKVSKRKQTVGLILSSLVSLTPIASNAVVPRAGPHVLPLTATSHQAGPARSPATARKVAATAARPPGVAAGNQQTTSQSATSSLLRSEMTKVPVFTVETREGVPLLKSRAGQGGRLVAPVYLDPAQAEAACKACGGARGAQVSVRSLWTAVADLGSGPRRLADGRAYEYELVTDIPRSFDAEDGRRVKFTYHGAAESFVLPVLYTPVLKLRGKPEAPGAGAVAAPRRALFFSVADAGRA